jgi:peptidoglycan-associated lipoprotein
MKSRIWLAFCFSIIILGGCSSKDGLGGLGGNASTSGFGDISESSIEYFTETVGDTILFEVNKSTLEPETIINLQAQARWLGQNSSIPITIEGHADEQGTREYNLALGARRATSVRNYLVSQGIPEARLSIVTYGKERPIEVCSMEKCWSKNRRSVTVVSGGLGS